MAGGPVCTFNGKTLPCFVCASPNASITSDLLVKMLQFIDDSGAFPLNGPNDFPFLLLDGHHSRMTLDFVQYVNNPTTRWMACLGVPYGTHIWQPADSSEINGSFKIHF